MNKFISRLLVVSSITVLFFSIFISTASASIVSGSSSTADNSSNGSASLVISLPSSVSAGDFLIATVAFDKGASTTISTPAGWTSILTTNNGIKTGVATFYKFAGESEPSNYTWALTPSRRAVGGIVKYTGVDSLNPIYTTSNATGHSDTASSPSIIINDANSEILAIFSLDDDRSLDTSLGMTEKFDVSNPNSNGPSISFDDKVQLLAGTVPASSISLGNPIRRWVAQQIVLKPKPPFGVLQVTKTVVNDNVGTSTPSSFSFKIDNGPILQFNSDGINNNILLPGTYSVVETSVNDYSVQYNNCSNVTVSEGATTTCSIINNDLPGSLLTVRKVVEGGSAVPSDFTLFVSSSTVQSGQQNFFETGTYIVSEQGPSNYRTVYSGDCDANGNISLGVNGIKTCVSTSYVLEDTLSLCTNSIDDDHDGITDLYDASCQPFIPRLNVIIQVQNNDGGTSRIGFTGDSNTIFAALFGPPGDLPGTTVGGAFGYEYASQDETFLLNPGSYHINPRVIASGYQISSSSDCSGSISPGETKTCAIDIDDITPVLTVVKHVINRSGGTAIASDFIMQVSGTDVSTSTFPGDESGVAVTLFSGSYNVTNSGPSGYFENSTDCSGNITIGQTKTCTITSSDVPLVENTLSACTDELDNDENGLTDLYDPSCQAFIPRLNVLLQVQNDNGGTSRVGFTGDSNTIFAALFGPPGNLPGTTVGGAFGYEYASPNETFLLNNGSYHVNPRIFASGYQITSSPDCDSTISPGETKTCTITFDDIQPQVLVVKRVVNNDGGMAVAGDFTINVSGSNVSTSTFSGSESGTLITLDSGSYSISDLGPSGYFENFSPGCSGNISIGQSNTCTITSSDIELVEATLALCTDGQDNDLDGLIDLYDPSCQLFIPSLNVILQVQNDNGGTSRVGFLGTSDSVWASLFGPAGNLPGTTVGGAFGFEYASPNETFLLNPGSYHVGVRVLNSGYQITNSTDCEGTITPGDVRTCTITVDDIAPQLTVIKHLLNDNGGSALSSNFTMLVNGTNVSNPSFLGSDVGTTITLNSGSYDVIESGPSGYTMLAGTNCSGSIALGESRLCTIINDDIPPALILIKNVINDNSGTATTTDWTLSADGPTPISGAGFVTSEISNGFMSGTYSLSESGSITGYTASPWSCVGDVTNTGNSITMSIGQNATCTITNDDN